MEIGVAPLPPPARRNGHNNILRWFANETLFIVIGTYAVEGHDTVLVLTCDDESYMGFVPLDDVEILRS